jgi:hypothetical protein
MELLTEKSTAVFEYKDVKFTIRTNVTVGDKFEFDTSGTITKDDKIEFKPWELYKTMIRLFVISWEGVTKDGKPVLWDYETFMNSFPTDSEGGDLVMKLGTFISDKTGVLRGANEQRKNG